MSHMQTKCLGQTAERIEEQREREERWWYFVLFVFERERKKYVKTFTISE